MKLQEYITDIAAGPFGSNLKVSCFVEKGFPIIDGANLKGYKVTDNITKFVTEEKARSLHRSIAKRGDIVVTISGNVGQISYIPDDSEYEEYLVSQRQFRASFDRDKVNVAYLVYYFHTREGQYKILSFANQVGVPALAQPLKNFRNIEIDLPSKKEQDFIAAYIDNIEDKIAVNRRICENLEAQAQALFKHWFIDFAPFKNGNFCANREQNETCFNSAEVQPKITGKACKFVESELGMIPEGWRVGKFGDIADLIKPSIKPIENVDYSHYSIPAFDNNRIPSKDNGGTIKSNKFVIHDSVTLLSKLNPDHKRIWFVSKVGTNAICSTEFLPFYAKDREQSAFVYCYLNCWRNYREIANGAKGTTNSHQRIDANAILSRKLAYDKDTISIFCNLVRDLLKLENKAIQESIYLSQLRDTLLPKLMSDQIKV